MILRMLRPGAEGAWASVFCRYHGTGVPRAGMGSTVFGVTEMRT